jgi:hypothetical protein
MSLPDFGRILMEDLARDRAEPVDRSRTEERMLGAPAVSREPM